MENINLDEERVVTIQGVCEIMHCSRQWYYLKYRNLLTPIPTTTSEILYKEKDVLKLKESINIKPYKIVR